MAMDAQAHKLAALARTALEDLVSHVDAAKPPAPDVEALNTRVAGLTQRVNSQRATIADIRDVLRRYVTMAAQDVPYSPREILDTLCHMLNVWPDPQDRDAMERLSPEQKTEPEMPSLLVNRTQAGITIEDLPAGAQPERIYDAEWFRTHSPIRPVYSGRIMMSDRPIFGGHIVEHGPDAGHHPGMPSTCARCHPDQMDGNSPDDPNRADQGPDPV